MNYEQAAFDLGVNVPCGNKTTEVNTVVLSILLDMMAELQRLQSEVDKLKAVQP